MVKLFTGSRSDLAGYIEENNRTEYMCKDDFVLKNASSLAVGELTDLAFSLKLKNGGGVKLILDIRKFSIFDFRKGSKLAGKMKEVISSLVAESQSQKFQEGESSIQRIEDFIPEAPQYFDVNIDSDDEADNRLPTNSQDFISSIHDPKERRYLERLKEKLKKASKDEVSTNRYVYGDRLLAAKQKIKRIKNRVTSHGRKRSKSPIRTQILNHPTQETKQVVYNKLPLKNPATIEFNPEGDAYPFYNNKDFSEQEIIDELNDRQQQGVNANGANVIITSNQPVNINVVNDLVRQNHQSPEIIIDPIGAQRARLTNTSHESSQYYSANEGSSQYYSANDLEDINIEEPITSIVQNVFYRPKHIIYDYEECKGFTLTGEKASSDNQNDLYVFLESDYSSEINVQVRIQNKTVSTLR